jgi:hypothetical protein
LSAADLRSGTTVSDVTGTLAVSDPQYVLHGIATDATTGTLAASNIGARSSVAGSINLIPSMLISGITVDDVTGVMTSGSGASASEVASAVWANATRSLTDKTDYALTGNYDAAKTAAQASDIPSTDSIASAVWNATTRSLTTFGTLVSDIWNATTRTLTAFDFSVGLASDQPNYTPAKAGDKMDLIGTPNTTAIAAIQAGLATGGTIPTTIEIASATSKEVWNYTERTLSGGPLAYGSASRVGEAMSYRTYPGGGVTVSERVIDLDGKDIQQADLMSIGYAIYVQHDGTLLSTGTVSIADAVYETPQSDALASDWNFRHVLSAFTEVEDYTVVYTFTPESGVPFTFGAQVHVKL